MYVKKAMHVLVTSNYFSPNMLIADYTMIPVVIKFLQQGLS